MTAEGLPEGLVSNKEGVQPADEGDDRVEAEQVAYLWRGIAPLQEYMSCPTADGAFL